MRSAWSLLLILILLAFTGCASGSAASAHVMPVAPTRLAPQDAVGVMAFESTQQKLAQDVARCVGRAFDYARAETRGVKAIKIPDPHGASDFAIGSDDAAWQAIIHDAAFRQSVLGLDHLLVVSLSRSTGPETRAVEFGASGFVFGVDVTANRQVTASIKAVLVDLKNGRVAARVEAEALANSQTGAVFLWFILPIPHWSNPDPFVPACRKLGKGITRALVDWTGDSDAVSACIFVGLVKDKDWDNLTTKVLRLRGDTVLLPADVSAGSAGGGAKRQLDVQAKAYRCEAAPAK